jgi:RNA polymerase sigma-70 factor (ECF subfamily)
MRQYESNGDHDLVSKAKDGDMTAFETLVRKYQKPIYAFCYRMTGQHQSADDLSQETFIKAFVSLQSFKDGMDFFPWIRRIAVNNSLNYIKKRQREEPLGAREENIAADRKHLHQELPQDKLQRRLMENKFNQALEALPVEQKILFVLRALENLSYRDISELLNIPLGTVMSRLSRTRKKLKTILAEYL